MFGQLDLFYKKPILEVLRPIEQELEKEKDRKSKKPFTNNKKYIIITITITKKGVKLWKMKTNQPFKNYLKLT